MVVLLKLLEPVRTTQDITARFPLGKFIAVTGFPVLEIDLDQWHLEKAIAQKLNRNSEKPGEIQDDSGGLSISIA